MAGPVSHIVYAEKALQNFLPHRDKKLFMLGTIFPDIRVLKVIDRDKTHFTDVTLDDIEHEHDSFNAGMLFHTLIDTTREAFVLQHNAYANLPDSYLSTVALKVCEDMELYSKSTRWQTYTTYLEMVVPSEQQFHIPTRKIKQWHAMHREFLADPSFAKNAKFFSALGFNAEQIAMLSDLVTKITNSHIVDGYLDDFYNNLEQHLHS